ncbi:MAG TPA: hypothetical protein VGF94_04840 [Kofleriaceae bacterium]|jgi:hypothetical protein
MARKDEKKPEAETAEAKSDAKVEAKVDSTEAKTQPIVMPAADAPPKDQELPEIQPPAPKGEPWPDATPEPMRPVEPPRARTETAVMPKLAEVGAPPEMPKTSAPPPPAAGAVESPTHMPGPREVPGGNPDDAAPAPGLVPRGDSRSLRRARDFALIYRLGTFVIARTGVIGTRGVWRVVEYPTSTAASHAYAKECSRFVSEGFSDYRE